MAPGYEIGKQEFSQACQGDILDKQSFIIKATVSFYKVFGNISDPLTIDNSPFT
jgi:hypothetical protein